MALLGHGEDPDFVLFFRVALDYRLCAILVDPRWDSSGGSLPLPARAGRDESRPRLGGIAIANPVAFALIEQERSRWSSMTTFRAGCLSESSDRSGVAA